MLEDRRSCSQCGGVVDVMIVDKPLAPDRSIPMKIGACLRCGQWFNEAGLLELRRVPQDPPDDTSN